ncbi:TonB family protein [Rheinheimera soli]|uniref:TonB family protein n=1 Tax=Rheinheimera soli TaxID=443616 RepID=UPI001E655153|nr:TonB family protein [Rheinheimera soli]
MRKSLLAASLLLSTLAQADLLDALQHYERKDYPKATAEFTQLLPLGNEVAAFNLAVMSYKGEGTAKDPVKALAYFQLAAELGDTRAAGVISSISKQLSATELQQADEQSHLLLEQVLVKTLEEDNSDRVNFPEVVSRKAPAYPKDAAHKGLFGYNVLRFVIDEQGNVSAVEVLGSFPAKTFDKASIRAIQSWKYAATGQKHQGKVALHYSLGPLSKHKVTQFMQKNQLVEYALAGSPQHQYMLGTMMDLLATNANYHVNVDKDLPVEVSKELPEQFFSRNSSFKTRIEGFYGSAEVNTNEKGVITRVVSSDKMELQQASALLVGKELDEDASQGHYKLWADPGKVAVVEPVITLSQLHSGHYWWNMAAKNGSLDAQRQLAAFSPQWENYLLLNNDPQVQTWSGVRKILQGDKVEGQLLLDKAVAQNYELAAELKATL